MLNKMSKSKKAPTSLLIALITALIGFLAWKYLSPPKPSLRYEELSTKDPFEKIARETGGTCRNDKDEVITELPPEKTNEIRPGSSIFSDK